MANLFFLSKHGLCWEGNLGDNDFFGWIISFSKAWFETHYTFNSRQLEFPFFFNPNDNLSLFFSIFHLTRTRYTRCLRGVTRYYATTPDLLNSRWMMGCAIFGFHHLFLASIALFQNARHFSFLLFTCKLVLVAPFLNSKFKGIFSLKVPMK